MQTFPSTDEITTTQQEDQILKAAGLIIENRFKRESVDSFSSPQLVKEFLKYKLAGCQREVFSAMLLDNQHRLIAFEEIAWGTIDSAAVYPRVVLQAVLNFNAAAVILAHNHPSGISEPSRADEGITQRIIDTLKLIDVRVLDHMVVGEDITSFAEKGLI